MKKVVLIVIAIMLVIGLTGTAMTKAPVGETVTINWLEDAVRKNPDGSVAATWFNDALGPADLVKTGKAYHFADIGEYYNTPLDNLAGKLVISGSGRLSGHATYTSPASGLPIRDRFKGEVTVEITDAVAGTGTMEGTYTQWSYAFGSEEDVHSSYPDAVPAKKQGSGWWLVGYTEYIAH